MLWTIAKREILDNLMSMKFLLGTILCLALVIVGTVVSLQDYQTRMAEYESTVAAFDESSWYDSARTVRKPEPLSIFAHGFDKRLGSIAWSVASSIAIGIPAVAERMEEGQMYKFVSGFASSIDLLFVTRVMISLMAIFLAYDVVSGEYERGTLKLTLSRPVSRTSVILGKLVAGIVCLLVPLVISFIVGILIIHLIGRIALSSEEWLRVAFIFAISILCVSSFYMIGVVVSTRTRHTDTSLLILLLIWVSTVFLIPGITTAAISRYRLMLYHPGNDIARIKSDLDIRTREIYRTPGPDRREDPDAWLRYWRNIRMKIAKVEDETEQVTWNIQRQYLNRLYYQADLARWICRISPSESCAYATEAMARTDVEAYRHFMRYARARYKLHREYVKEFNNKTIGLDREELYNEQEKGKKEYGKTVESPPVDLSASLYSAAPDAFLLVTLNVLLLILSILFFIRHDVH